MLFLLDAEACTQRQGQGGPKRDAPPAWPLASTAYVADSKLKTLAPAVQVPVPDEAEPPGLDAAHPVPGEEGPAQRRPEAEQPPPPDALALADAARASARRAFEQRYPLFGVAYHVLSQIHARPDTRSPVVGYMRRGAQFRSGPTGRGPGCRAGFAELTAGGFVCRGQGFDLGEGVQRFEPSPHPPSRQSALPYAYGRVMRRTPQYWRVPTPEEEAATARWMDSQPAPGRAKRDAPLLDVAPPPGLASAGPQALEAAAAAPREAPPAAAPPPAKPSPDVAGMADAGVDDPRPSYVRLIMRRGFYVSIDRLLTDGARRFYRTVRGGVVPASAIAPVKPPSTRGVVLGGQWQLPLAFAVRGGVRALRRDPVTGALHELSAAHALPRHAALPLSTQRLVRKGHRYALSQRGVFVREDALAIARARTPPADIGERARWIHVDLGEQVVVAYEGPRPVFAALISSGRAGFETPEGRYRIQSKHISATMDDLEAGDDAYSIEDVPWTMYFQGGYALHGAFWHQGFGRARSHGCVNLAPADARWLFHFSAPHLPAAWHGMSTAGGGTGTTVVVEGPG